MSQPVASRTSGPEPACCTQRKRSLCEIRPSRPQCRTRHTVSLSYSTLAEPDCSISRPQTAHCPLRNCALQFRQSRPESPIKRYADRQDKHPALWVPTVLADDKCCQNATVRRNNLLCPILRGLPRCLARSAVRRCRSGSLRPLLGAGCSEYTLLGGCWTIGCTRNGKGLRIVACNRVWRCGTVGRQLASGCQQRQLSLDFPLPGAGAGDIC